MVEIYRYCIGIWKIEKKNEMEWNEMNCRNKKVEKNEKIEWNRIGKMDDPNRGSIFRFQ